MVRRCQYRTALLGSQILLLSSMTEEDGYGKDYESQTDNGTYDHADHPSIGSFFL
jgi:hypothetical protein